MPNRTHACGNQRMQAERRGNRNAERTKTPAQLTRAPFQTGCDHVTDLRCPNFRIARGSDGRYDAFDFALSAVRVQTRRARRDVLAVLVALLVARFTQRDRAGDRFDAIVHAVLHALSAITARSVRMARHTRWRTASAVVPRIVAASADE